MKHRTYIFIDTEDQCLFIILCIIFRRDITERSQTHPACQFKTSKINKDCFLERVFIFIFIAPDKSWLDLQYGANHRIKRPHELEKNMQEPPENIDNDLLNHVHGSMIGMALDDALGARVEFRPHSYMLKNPVTNLMGGGTWGLEKGQV